MIYKINVFLFAIRWRNNINEWRYCFVVVWTEGGNNSRNKSQDEGNWENSILLSFLVSVLSLLMSLLHSTVSNRMISLMVKKSTFCLQKSYEWVILMMCIWWREKVCCRNAIVWKREEKGEKENVLSKDFLSKKVFRQNGRMFSSEWEKWGTIFSTWQGLSKWGWSVCFLGAFSLHMARMMFDEKGKRFFFVPVDCDCIYCCEHTEWYFRCFPSDIPLNNLSQSFFEQKNLFLFSEKMKLLCNGTFHHKNNTDQGERTKRITDDSFVVYSFLSYQLSAFLNKIRLSIILMIQ